MWLIKYITNNMSSPLVFFNFVYCALFSEKNFFLITSLLNYGKNFQKVKSIPKKLHFIYDS